MLKAEKLSKSYGERKVLENISLEIPEGNFISLLGPSGCGKSTLLRILSRLDEPTSGNVQFGVRARERAFVFQDPTLLPWLTVRENVEFPFKLMHERPDGVNEVLAKVGLSNSQNLFPYQLSGGMRMRTSIARALVTKPRLLFMDEPFSALDEATRFELQEDLYELWSKEKVTVIFVTHSISEAVYLSDRVLVMSPKGNGISWEQNIKLPQLRGAELRTHYEFNAHVELLSQKLRSVKYV
ncbi:MAG: ABC transporter ATP-binding protein [Bdellovibrionota bacterium]